MTMRNTWSGALASVDAQLRGLAARGHGKH
jgi:hypothetical protein